MKIGIIGIAGQMGRLIAKEVIQHDLTDLVSGLTREGYDEVGSDLGTFLGMEPTKTYITDNLEVLYELSDMVIDFSSPELTRRCLSMAAKTGKALVCGTTGLSMEDKVLLNDVANQCPIMYSNNMSVGMHLLMAAVQKMANKLYDGYDIEVSETCDRFQKEVPSATALALGEAAATGRGWLASEVFCHDRWGGASPRTDKEIGFAINRGGEAFQEQSVSFLGSGEEIVLRRRRFDYSSYAEGALRAAVWLYGKPAGLYTMENVLSLDKI